MDTKLVDILMHMFKNEDELKDFLIACYPCVKASRIPRALPRTLPHALPPTTFHFNEI